MFVVGISNKIKPYFFQIVSCYLSNYNIYPSVCELTGILTSEIDTLYFYSPLHHREHRQRNGKKITPSPLQYINIQNMSKFVVLIYIIGFLW